MGCDISVYKTTTVSTDVSTSTELLERTELLDYKSWELGEILAGALETPNGCTCSVDPVHLASLLTDYRDDPDCDDCEEEMLTDCISEVVDTIDDDKSAIYVNVWW